MANIKISELNSLIEKDYTDVLPIVDTSANETKKISIEKLIDNNIKLIDVSDIAPSECVAGDKYYNTIINKIYTATGTDTWGTTGEDAKEGILYIVFDTQELYAFNGTTLIKIGDGTGIVDYPDTTNKPQINGVTLTGNKTSQDLGLTGLTPQNTYSESTDESYACSYANNNFKTKVVTLWSGQQTTTGNLTLDDNIYNYDIIFITIAISDKDNANTTELLTSTIVLNKSHFITMMQDSNTSLSFNITFTNATTLKISNISKSGGWSSLTPYMTKVTGIKY